VRIKGYFTARPPSEDTFKSYTVGRVLKATVALGSSGGVLSVQVTLHWAS